MAVQRVIKSSMVLRVSFLFALLLTACSEGKETDVSATPEMENYLSGKDLYNQRCASCHGMDGKLGLSEAADLSTSTLSSIDIQKIIEEGKGVMPPFKLLIESDKTMEETIDYVQSLRSE